MTRHVCLEPTSTPHGHCCALNHQVLFPFASARVVVPPDSCRRLRMESSRGLMRAFCVDVMAVASDDPALLAPFDLTGIDLSREGSVEVAVVNRDKSASISVQACAWGFLVGEGGCRVRVASAFDDVG